MQGYKVDVYVEPDSNSPNGYRFWMEKDQVKKDTLEFNKTKDNMRKSEDYKVEFKLHNHNGAKLHFSKDKGRVLWAAVSTGGPPYSCPPANSICDEFYVDPAAFIQDDLLTVINTDMTYQDISFALNFLEEGESDGPNANYVCYDPIASNQNGGRSATKSSTTTYLAVGAAVVVGAGALYACGAFGS
jgi:hypothetical protein